MSQARIFHVGRTDLFSRVLSQDSPATLIGIPALVRLLCCGLQTLALVIKLQLF